MLERSVRVDRLPAGLEGLARAERLLDEVFFRRALAAELDRGWFVLRFRLQHLPPRGQVSDEVRVVAALRGHGACSAQDVGGPWSLYGVSRQRELSELGLVGGAEIHVPLRSDVRLGAMHVSLPQRLLLVVGFAGGAAVERSVGDEGRAVGPAALPLGLVGACEVGLLGRLRRELYRRLRPKLPVAGPAGRQVMLLERVPIPGAVGERSAGRAPLFLAFDRLAAAGRVLREVLLAGGAPFELLRGRLPGLGLTTVAGREAPLLEIGCGRTGHHTAVMCTLGTG